MADSVEQVVYEYLAGDTSFMSDFTGVYWLDADSPSVPYINFWLVTDSGDETMLNKNSQGSARIQFDLWDSNKIRGARLRTKLAEKVRVLNEESGGYHVMTEGIMAQTIPRQSETDLYHFVIDGTIKWNK